MERRTVGLSQPNSLPRHRERGKLTARMMLFVSRNWLAVFTALVAAYVGISFAAPVLMALGSHALGSMVYKLYWLLCHQFAHRSWFLFGQATFYPAQHIPTLDGIDHLSTAGRWASKIFLGNDVLGWKVALCERDVAIYGGILASGIIYGVLRAQGVRVRSVPWLVYILIGIAPIVLDGFSQLLSQPPYMLPFLTFRESTPILRSLTGFLFGAMNVWLAYPCIEKWMEEVRDELGDRLIPPNVTKG